MLLVKKYILKSTNGEIAVSSKLLEKVHIISGIIIHKSTGNHAYACKLYGLVYSRQTTIIPHMVQSSIINENIRSTINESPNNAKKNDCSIKKNGG